MKEVGEQVAIRDQILHKKIDKANQKWELLFRMMKEMQASIQKLSSGNKEVFRINLLPLNSMWQKARS